MSEWLLFLAVTSGPLWALVLLLLYFATAKDRREKRRSRRMTSHCPCNYLGFMADYPGNGNEEGGGPYACLCDCYFTEDGFCPCQCQTRGCYQDLVYGGFRE